MATSRWIVGYVTAVIVGSAAGCESTDPGCPGGSTCAPADAGGAGDDVGPAGADAPAQPTGGSAAEPGGVPGEHAGGGTTFLGDAGTRGGTPGTAGVSGAGGAPAQPEPCDVVAPTACPEPMPRYADVQPIFESRCIGCHAGEPGGSWPLTDYEHVADWHDTIRGAMLTCAMPPPDSGLPMSLAERHALLDWIRCGYPE